MASFIIGAIIAIATVYGIYHHIKNNGECSSCDGGCSGCANSCNHDEH